MAKHNTKTSEVKAHATYSASGAERWLNCPGSISLCKDLPDPPESSYAAEGTKAHACLELFLKNRDKSLTATSKVARSMGFDADMIEHAIDVVRWCYLKAEELGKGAEIVAEEKVDSSFFTMPGQFGTLDIKIYKEFGRLVIADYKYGAGIAVDPDENPQLIYYALAAAKAHDFNFKDVELVVIQPRANHHSGEVIRSVVMKMSELVSWKDTFLEGVEDTLKADAPHVPGKWCRFCKGAHVCPGLKENAIKEAQVVFDDDLVVTTPDPFGLALKDLGKILGACDKLETWIGAVREFAFNELKAGRPVPGYKLVEKRANRKWKDEEDATKWAVRTFGEKALRPLEVLSPAQLEKKFKGLAKDFLECHTVRESSGLTLAEASDKRPAVEAASKVFEGVD